MGNEPPPEGEKSPYHQRAVFHKIPPSQLSKLAKRIGLPDYITRRVPGGKEKNVGTVAQKRGVLRLTPFAASVQKERGPLGAAEGEEGYDQGVPYPQEKSLPSFTHLEGGRANGRRGKRIDNRSPRETTSPFLDLYWASRRALYSTYIGGRGKFTEKWGVIASLAKHLLFRSPNAAAQSKEKVLRFAQEPFYSELQCQ